MSSAESSSVQSSLSASLVLPEQPSYAAGSTPTVPIREEEEALKDTHRMEQLYYF